MGLEGWLFRLKDLQTFSGVSANEIVLWNWGGDAVKCHTSAFGAGTGVGTDSLILLDSRRHWREFLLVGTDGGTSGHIFFKIVRRSSGNNLMPKIIFKESTLNGLNKVIEETNSITYIPWSL